MTNGPWFSLSYRSPNITLVDKIQNLIRCTNFVHPVIARSLNHQLHMHSLRYRIMRSIPVSSFLTLRQRPFCSLVSSPMSLSWYQWVRTPTYLSRSENWEKSFIVLEHKDPARSQCFVVLAWFLDNSIDECKDCRYLGFFVACLTTQPTQHSWNRSRLPQHFVRWNTLAVSSTMEPFLTETSWFAN